MGAYSTGEPETKKTLGSAPADSTQRTLLRRVPKFISDNHHSRTIRTCQYFINKEKTIPVKTKQTSDSAQLAKLTFVYRLLELHYIPVSGVGTQTKIN